ncbi:sedoheptulose 7-phosphate cyclase [Amycolatopsis nigrescens]|uniref:sedoheptulose 7-phosphate cyclase n=1 Tax=Amycolatopsis nigrescens TaxID=381445 RepID=UPI00037D233F|nr:sedoheptulose 7-phosphate cyclase [Amycolatopsis nigrescens]
MALTMLPDGAWSVTAKQVVEYAVRPVPNVLNGTFEIPGPDSAECDLLGRTPAGSMRRLVVVDREVMRLYGRQVRGFLDRHGIEYRLLVLPGGEATKTMRTVLRVCRELDDFGIARRSEPVIVFGGGVLNDVVGMAASIYRRGIERIVYGTTLVALVDATVGAKTASDHNGFKNRLGTYRPARLVIADRSFLATQERRRLSDGLAEILKLGIVCDKSLFELLEDYGGLVLDERFQAATPTADAAATQIIEDGIKVMLTELHENLWEGELARATYFGHTWSPKVEMEALRRSRSPLAWRRRRWLLHGEAVALDMLLSVSIACSRGLISESELDRIVAVVRQLDLPTWDPLLDEPAILAAGLEDSVRHRDGEQLAPLPESIGSVTYANDITPAEVTAAVDWMRSLRKSDNRETRHG